ncbi:hypothetical protein Pan153_17610 [Gimesia panareensis]|uniref:Uncharacterized protein n=2 Tax=Gimesia panareensis TaxID=2527978 RepID=A0A518FL78_9PLAN|nr:hypothetical protein Pan153_17610 [Gimesia panareensis]
MTDDGWNSYTTSKLTASDATDYAYFGESVSISEDENTIIAGDPYHNSAGAVYLFSRDNSGTASPGDDSWSEFKMLTAVETDSQFGTSVGIEGGIAVIGSNGDAYVIQESENWDVLTSLAGIGETKPVRFGLGVAISGDVILVGGPDFNDPADPGSIYLFDGWNGWESPDIEQLYALDPNLNETFFTESIAISGGTIIAGWRNHAHDGVQTGVAYAYEYQPVIDLKADIIDGSLVINNLTNENASVSLSVSDGALVVTHPDNRLVPPEGGNQVNVNQFTIPLSALTSGEIYINGGTGNEHVSVDTSLAAAGLKVIFSGGEGGGFDSLELTGTASSAEYLFENEHDGKVQLNHSGLDFISYTGLEPITSSIDAAQITLVYSDADETITVSSPASGQLSVDSTAGEIITFQNFTGKLTLDAGAGINTVNLNDLGASLTADFEILDSAGTETVILGDTLNLGSGKMTIAAETVQIAGAVTGAGDLEMMAATINFLNTGSSLNTGDGNIFLQAENSINLVEVISTGTVAITSTNGAIFDFNEGSNNITASRAILSAVNGAIGNTRIIEAGGASTNALETTIEYLEAIADGIIDITNSGDLIVGGIGTLNGIESIHERVVVSSYGSIEVREDIAAYAQLLLRTKESAIASLKEDILIQSGVTIHSETIYVGLYSDDDLTIEEQALLQAPANHIYLRVNYNSSDRVGGVLKLAGMVETPEPKYRTYVYGSAFADSFLIAPSLNSLISVIANSPASPDLIGDTLNYLLPEGETATLTPISDSDGTVSFTGAYADITYTGIETLQQGDLQQLAGQLRVEGTAADDVLTINATNENSGTWQLNSGPEVAFSGINELAFYGLTGDDRLVINHPDGTIFNPASGILYDGGGQAGDELELTGGTAQSVQHRLDEGQNAIYFNGSLDPTVRYLGVGTVLADTNAVAVSLVGDGLTVSSDDGVQTRVTGNTGVLFSTFSGLLALEGASESATIQLNSLGSGMTGTLLVGGGTQEMVMLNDGLDLGSADVTIHAGSVQVTGEVTSSGEIQIEATSITFADENSGIDAGAGNIELISSDDLIVGNLRTTGNVILTSLNGDIERVTTGATTITAFSAVLSAEKGMIGYPYDLYTELSHLEVVSFGVIKLRNTGDLTIGGVGALDGAKSFADRVLIYSYGGLEFQENITALNNVQLLALGSEVLSLNEDIIVRSGVTINSEAGSLILYADDDLTIEEESTLQAAAGGINLRVNYNSNDGVGGILDLAGNLITLTPSYRTTIRGSNQDDTFRIIPSLTSQTLLSAFDPLPPDSPGDELIYYIPSGESALHVAGTDAGTISFTGGYYDIDYGSIESFTLAGSLTLEGTSGDDVLTINATDVNSGTFQLNDGPAMAFTDLTDLTFLGLEGNDRLVINHPTEGLFAPLNGILFEGGDQTSGDSLEILGGTATSVEHRFANENDGSIFYNGQTTAAITYTGLEPVLDTIAATDRIFSFTGESETITLSDEGDPGDGESQIDSTLGESVVFTHPTGTLTINTEVAGGAGADTIIINNVDSTFTAGLTINAGNDDTLMVNTVNFGSGNLDLNANQVNVDGTLTTSGSVEIDADSQISFADAGVIDTTANTVNLTAGQDIQLGQIITSGAVQLISTAGAVFDGTSTGNSLIQSGNLLIQAATGIGGVGDADIKTEASQITADSFQGPMIISNFGGLFVQLSELPDLILNEDAGEQTINLSQITTAGGTAQTFSVTAVSSQPNLIPDPLVNYATAETTDSLVLTPAPEQAGTATITVVVIDGGEDHLLETAGDNRTVYLSFDVTVASQNDDPELDPISDLLISTNAPEQTVSLSGITAGGGESQPLRVTAQSSNPSLIPDPVISYTSDESTGSLLFTPATDQAGTATITVTVEDGGLDGNLETTADNATFTRSFDITVRELETVSLRVVETPSSTGAQGETDSLPVSQQWISEWGSYWLEIWVSTEDLSSQGFAAIDLDLSYLTDFTSATGIEYGSAFSQNQTGIINDHTGQITNLSATAETTDLGVNSQLLFARIRFESLAGDQVLLNLEEQSIGPHDLAFQLQSSQLVLGNARVSQTPMIDTLGADIWANPYDLNDDDAINFRDLILFVSVYNSIPAESGSDYGWVSDFNQNNRVDFRDLILLASNYGKRKVNQTEINYPDNYPVAWNNQLQVSNLPQLTKKTSTLAQPQADMMLQTAVQEVSSDLSKAEQQRLSDIKVEVVDLEGAALGQAKAGTIYIDINAAGYGWFIDETPLDHSEFQYDSQLSLIALPGSKAEGLIDLWTVIRHELGHLLGYEHTDQGVMEATLEPGIRKLPVWDQETDLFFASLKEETELLSS